MDKEIQSQLYDPKKHSKRKNPRTWRAYLKAKMSIYMKRYGSHKAAIRKIAKEWKSAKVRVLDPHHKNIKVYDPQSNFYRPYSLKNGKWLSRVWYSSNKDALDAARMFGHDIKDVKIAESKGSFYQGKLIRKGSVATYDPAPVKHGINRPPKRWFYAMLKGIEKRSDVRNPAAIVGSIWKRLSPTKRAEIKRREVSGKPFKYDLPLPDDRATHGTGTLRMVKPFKLTEVQVNVSLKDYLAALKSGLFQRMKRGDGTTALVARCKSAKKNCNIFVDKMEAK